MVYFIPGFARPVFARPAARIIKLLKGKRIMQFVDRSECVSNFPIFSRLTVLCMAMLMVMHWNACLYYFLSIEIIEKGYPNVTDLDSRSNFIYPPSVDMDGHANKYASTSMKYAFSLYWSTQTMTTIGEVQQPTEVWEYFYLTFVFLVGVMIFASVVGSIGNVITNLRANRNLFQDRLDNLKEYMGYRKVGKDLSNRIIRWFDYLWAQNHTFEEEDVLK